MTKNKVSKQKKEVQSLVFNKDKFTKEEALKWAKEHNFSAAKLDEKKNTLRIRQFNASKCAPNTFETFIEEFPDGIQAVACDVIGKKKRITDRRKHRDKKDDDKKKTKYQGGNKMGTSKFSEKDKNLLTEITDVLDSLIKNSDNGKVVLNVSAVEKLKEDIVTVVKNADTAEDQEDGDASDTDGDADATDTGDGDDAEDSSDSDDSGDGDKGGDADASSGDAGADAGDASKQTSQNDWKGLADKQMIAINKMEKDLNEVKVERDEYREKYMNVKDKVAKFEQKEYNALVEKTGALWSKMSNASKEDMTSKVKEWKKSKMSEAALRELAVTFEKGLASKPSPVTAPSYHLSGNKGAGSTGGLSPEQLHSKFKAGEEITSEEREVIQDYLAVKGAKARGWDPKEYQK